MTVQPVSWPTVAPIPANFQHLTAARDAALSVLMGLDDELVAAEKELAKVRDRIDALELQARSGEVAGTTYAERRGALLQEAAGRARFVELLEGRRAEAWTAFQEASVRRDQHELYVQAAKANELGIEIVKHLEIADQLMAEFFQTRPHRMAQDARNALQRLVGTIVHRHLQISIPATEIEPAEAAAQLVQGVDERELAASARTTLAKLETHWATQRKSNPSLYRSERSRRKSGAKTGALQEEPA